MFKSKSEKDMEQRMIVKKTIRNFNKHILELEDQKNKYLEVAKKAKADGLEAQANLALSGLNMALMQQRKAKEMLLNFELASQMKDLTKVTAIFLDGMSMLSKEMGKTTKGMNFSKVQKEFEVAINGVTESSEQLELLMDSTSDSYSMVANNDSAIKSSELDKFLEAQLDDSEISIDAEIEASLSALKESMKE